MGAEAIHSRETSDAGSVRDRPVVLLHGVGATSRYFLPLLRELDGCLPASAPELPGIGASTAGTIPEDVAGQADVVAGWMRATARHHALVVGNSMGAQTAVELAIRHPDPVVSLTLIGPTIDRASRGPAQQIWRLLVDATVEKPSLIMVTLSDSFLTRRRAVLRYARAALRHHLEQRLGSVQVPVLVVRGEHDSLSPRRWIHELAQVAAGIRTEEIPGGAHACHHGRPRAVADLLAAEYELLAGSSNRAT